LTQVKKNLFFLDKFRFKKMTIKSDEFWSPSNFETLWNRTYLSLDYWTIKKHGSDNYTKVSTGKLIWFPEKEIKFFLFKGLIIYISSCVSINNKLKSGLYVVILYSNCFFCGVFNTIVHTFLNGIIFIESIFYRQVIKNFHI
jgi:hypothetical protein